MKKFFVQKVLCTNVEEIIYKSFYGDGAIMVEVLVVMMLMMVVIVFRLSLWLPF